MLFRKYSDTYIGDLEWINYSEEFTRILTEFQINTVYLVNQSEEFTKSQQLIYPQFTILNFTGGFMLNSIVLFTLKTVEDNLYISQTLNLEL